MTTNTKNWLTEFLLIRLLSAKNLSKPLYKYEVTDEEYLLLLTVLKEDKVSMFHPVQGAYWSAGFCLYVAERYRREYDGSEGGWSWQGYDVQLGITITHDQRKQMVRQGLKYWGRSLRVREHGNDYLGSLFAEGGLPWRLLTSDTNGFGRAIKNGIRNYHSSKKSGISLIDSVKEFAQYFPIAFRNQETYLLLTSVVESLMLLAQLHDLRLQDDPSTYLDEHQANWRDSFPLPIGQSNGRTLVNEWLRDAGIKQKELENARDKAKSFTSEHHLMSDPDKLRIETTVFLPHQEEISFSSALSSTRLEMVFYEGSQSILNAGIIYSRLNEERTSVTLSFPHTEYKISRENIDQPLILQLLSNGTRVAVFYFQNSDLDLDEAPLIFTNEESPLLLANSSISTSLRSVLIRTPAGTILDENIKPISKDQNAGCWYKIEHDTLINIKGINFNISFKEFAHSPLPIIKGHLCLYDTLPSLTYYGVPSAHFESLTTEAANSEAVVTLENLSAKTHSNTGIQTMSISTNEALNLYKKKIGIVPKDLSLTSLCSTSTSPAKLILKSAEKLYVSIANEEVQASVEMDGDVTSIKIKPKPNMERPARLRIQIRSIDVDVMPVEIRIPFPYQGATLINSGGQIVNKSVISLNELLGMSMLLTSTRRQQQSFYMVAELRSETAQPLKRSYQFKVSQQPLSINLHAFHADFMQLLSTVTEQDAVVRVRVETDQLIKQFELSRYAGMVKDLNHAGYFTLNTDVSIHEKPVACTGVHLNDPAELPISIPRRVSAGIDTDYFEIPQTMKSKGPWLIVPSEGSGLLFRPAIWITDDMEEQESEIEYQPQTLHHAAAVYHPTFNPKAFNQVIDSMAMDMSHSGWIYLTKLKENYSYLPSSVFMAWHAISENTQALALLVMRLDIDDLFCTQMVNDLAVIWEAVSVEEWIQAIANYRSYLCLMGIPDSLIEYQVIEKMNRVKSVIPVIKHLHGYLISGDPNKIYALPESTLFIGWYRELKRRHSEDDRWPEFLDHELASWLASDEKIQHYINVINMGFEKSVVYFPIFMAYLTAGYVKLGTLNRNLSETKFALRVLSDFDREGWYEPIYALVLSNLIKSEENQ